MPPTMLLVVNLVGAVAVISYAVNSRHQSWGPLLGNLRFLGDCSPLPVPQGSNGTAESYTNHSGCVVGSPGVHLFIVVGSYRSIYCTSDRLCVQQCGINC